MTPTATRLKARLEERRSWFYNEWFFKWHFVGKDGPISIDFFDGRGIHLGGIAFDGSVRQVYWEAVTRGVRKEITEQFEWIDNEARKYTAETALRAIDECAGQLISFVQVIRRAAIEKDRILRGDGVRFPPANDAGHWHETSAADIQSQAEALKKALPLTARRPNEVSDLHDPMPLGERASAAWHRNQWWLGPIALFAGLAGLAMPFLL